MTAGQGAFIITGLLLLAGTIWAAWGSVGNKERQR